MSFISWIFLGPPPTKPKVIGVYFIVQANFLAHPVWSSSFSDSVSKIEATG